MNVARSIDLLVHLPNLIYEYKKDIKIYLAAVAIIAAYRYYRGQRSDAKLQAGEGQAPGGGASSASMKLAVQTAKGERLLEIGRIDYLEAAHNYVAVHAEGEQYLVRSPLSALLTRLPAGRFVRTHRSYWSTPRLSASCGPRSRATCWC